MVLVFHAHLGVLAIVYTGKYWKSSRCSWIGVEGLIIFSLKDLSGLFFLKNWFIYDYWNEYFGELCLILQKGGGRGE